MIPYSICAPPRTDIVCLSGTKSLPTATGEEMHPLCFMTVLQCSTVLRVSLAFIFAELKHRYTYYLIRKRVASWFRLAF